MEWLQSHNWNLHSSLPAEDPCFLYLLFTTGFPIKAKNAPHTPKTQQTSSWWVCLQRSQTNKCFLNNKVNYWPFSIEPCAAIIWFHAAFSVSRFSLRQMGRIKLLSRWELGGVQLHYSLQYLELIDTFLMKNRSRSKSLWQTHCSIFCSCFTIKTTLCFASGTLAAARNVEFASAVP